MRRTKKKWDNHRHLRRFSSSILQISPTYHQSWRFLTNIHRPTHYRCNSGWPSHYGRTVRVLNWLKCGFNDGVTESQTLKSRESNEHLQTRPEHSFSSCTCFELWKGVNYLNFLGKWLTRLTVPDKFLKAALWYRREEEKKSHGEHSLRYPFICLWA